MSSGADRITSEGSAHESNESRLAEQLAAWMVNYWAPLVVAIGAVVLALPENDHGKVEIPSHPPEWIALVVGAVMTVIGVLASAKRSHRVTTLVRDRDGARSELTQTRRALKHLAEIELHRLGKQLGYYSAERISLFLRCESHFKLVARSSLNPNNTKADDRVYRDDGGCLSKAWIGNRTSVVIPARRQEDETGWLAAHTGTGLRAERATVLSMNVRTVVAQRINAQDTLGTPLGVLVIESEQTHEDETVGGRPTAVLEPNAALERLTAASPVFTELLSAFRVAGGVGPA